MKFLIAEQTFQDLKFMKINYYKGMESAKSAAETVNRLMKIL